MLHNHVSLSIFLFVTVIEQVIAEQPLLTRPGKTWIYSNFGYQLLGFIIERLAGMPYEQFVKAYIWDRVGVRDVQVARPTLSEKSGYVFINWIGLDTVF